MFCFKCGTAMGDDAAVCPQCGAAVADAPQVAPSPPAPPSQPWPGSPAPQQQYWQPPRTDGKATASMILGILGLLCFWGIAGIPAVILGHLSKADIRKNAGRLQGDGMATAGLIMGYISIVFGLLIFSAILIPNMLRARMDANHSAAMSSLRTITTAQVSYSTDYPSRGYARDLAVLGSGSSSCPGGRSADHACLLTGPLSVSQCTAGFWCTKGGYKFSMSGVCGADGNCTDYVIVATPVRPNLGRRSFCSTSDGVLRYKLGQITTPLTDAEDCQAWPEV
jgi:type IV pilus assembly protein PilA